MTQATHDRVAAGNAGAHLGAQPRRGGALRWVLTLVAMLLVAGGVYATWRWAVQRSAVQAARPAQARAVPVSGAKATRGDLPVYLTGLGTATAFNTVTVHSRVDGQLIKVFFTEGQLVNVGDPIAKIDPRPFEVQLEQSQGQLARDQASLTNAKLDLDRYQEAKEAIPQQLIDTASAAVGQYEGAVRVDQAQIDSAKLQITYTNITAPIGGRVGLRLVDEGNMIHASDTTGLVVITQLQPIAVQFSLPQDDLPQVVAGSKAGPLKAEAYDRDLKKKLADGTVLALDNQIDITTGTFRIKAQFANTDMSLFPNQFVNVRLLVDTERGVVLVPAAAIQRSPKGGFVYVVKADQTVEVRPVTVGRTEGDTTVITTGLSEGETVVTDGTDKLRAGATVTVHGPGMPEVAPPRGTASDQAVGQAAQGQAPGGRGGKGKGRGDR